MQTPKKEERNHILSILVLFSNVQIVRHTEWQKFLDTVFENKMITFLTIISGKVHKRSESERERIVPLNPTMMGVERSGRYIPASPYTKRGEEGSLPGLSSSHSRLCV